MKQYVPITVTTQRVIWHVVIQAYPVMVVRPMNVFERLQLWAIGKRAQVSAWMLDATHWRARSVARRAIERAKA